MLHYMRRYVMGIDWERDLGMLPYRSWDAAESWDATIGHVTYRSDYCAALEGCVAHHRHPFTKEFVGAQIRASSIETLRA